MEPEDTTRWEPDVGDYPIAIANLLTPARLAPLGPGRPNQTVREQLQNLTFDFVRDPDMAACCLAGLWLYHDFLDESHKICQDIETPEGSYWHALMHRREPDYPNAKYWFRRVGKHPVFEQLAAGWDALAFVDRCQAAGSGTDEETVCRKMQQREWELLFDYCYRHAV